MAEQWRRALLRAALREVGYDAVGARDLATAFRVRAAEPDRGQVKLVVIDQSALGGSSRKQLDELLRRFGSPTTVLIARATVAPPAGPWTRVLRRPISVDEVALAVEELIDRAAQKL